MKPSKRDQRFDDGALVRADFRDAGRRISPHKMAQLCKQILRAVDCALQSCRSNSLLWDLRVLAVDRTADPGRLRVLFALPQTAPSPDPESVMAALEAVRSQIHTEVAATITRRKAPQLVFELR